ncbi:MAG: RHS repeat-associated core domain-containing protein [Bacteroidetes bacterium]|nr:RHS repeat-associated core domain-containing protein [Bacteroidota bacterium]
MRANITYKSNNALTYYVYDHSSGILTASLGNTRITYTPTVMPDGLKFTLNGVYDYYPYGKILREYVQGPQEKYLTTHHQRDEETGLDYRGARFYDCDVARFLSSDPLARVAPAWNTYRAYYCNPLIFIDPTGLLESTEVTDNGDGTYNVVNGNTKDNDKGIYVVDKNGVRTGEKIGESLFIESFHAPGNDGGDGKWLGKIDTRSTEGVDFLNDEIIDPMMIITDYLAQNKKMDFKSRGDQGTKSEQNANHYRGSEYSKGVYASARDFGNIGAGIVAGMSDYSWPAAKAAFEFREGAKTFPYIQRVAEKASTVEAEKFGYDIGIKIERPQQHRDW